MVHPRLRTIVESNEVSKIIDKLPPSLRKSVDDTIELLLHDKPRKNQHALTGDLRGFSAIDVAGSGKGRGALRIVYAKTDTEILIHSIQDYH